jgi:DNA repair protein RadA/Sms
MPKNAHSFICSSCNAAYAKWVGKCGKCGEYGTVNEAAETHSASKSVGLKGGLKISEVKTPAKKVKDITFSQAKRTKTGISEFDRVLGGGFVPGQVILIAGEPGVGKSTLLLAAAESVANQGLTSLIVSGEESTEQIGVRAKRLGVNSDNLFIADETDMSVLLGHIEEVAPDFLVVDSIQTIASPDIEGRAGAVSQVQEVSAALTRVAKSKRMAMIIVAQITKDGNIAGPKYLEHLVDTVLYFDGDKHTSLRLLSVRKNRYGAADEVACFEQTDSGIQQVEDPSGLFLDERQEPISGTCVSVAMEGRRPLLVEIQALVSPTNSPNPRRGVSGLDYARMAMLIAVTEKHGRIRFYDKDTFLATVAGIKISEPAIDLSVCLALASAAWDIPFPTGVAAIGEVALSGDIRPVQDMHQRVGEANRLGFKKILVPEKTKYSTKDSDIVLIRVNHLGKALHVLRELGKK